MKIKWILTLLIICGQTNARSEVPILRSLLADPGIIFKEGKSWAPTRFEDQGDALGLEANSFSPPKNIEKAVAFWVRVYTEYPSSQGLIHDIDNLNIVYEKVDFDFINRSDTLSERQKAKARDQLVEDRKKEILAGLQRIATGVPEKELTESDKAFLALWEKDGGVAAINEAADMGRLRFQLGQSDRIKEAIYLSGRYLPMMEKTFKENGLPLQLTRLVFVESSFNILARSKVGASGLWQIMPSAARGRLRVNRVVDLRNHPQEATELAAKMLKFNYQMLGAWPLAITGYNHGPYGVKRLVEKNKTRDLGELIETGEGRRFGFASRNFFASFLAALHVESKAGEFFPGIKRAAPLNFEELKLKSPIYFSDLVKAFEGDREMAQLYNPHLQRLAYLDKVALDHKSRVVVPNHIIGNVEKTLSSIGPREDKVPPEIRKSFKRTKARNVAVSNSEDSKVYRVSKGDTLYRISRQFGVSIRSILSINDLKGPRSIRAGQLLQLP